MIKLLNYVGSKIKYTDIINPYIYQSNKNIYCEPFCGSAAVFFNLEKKFEQYILNDLDRNVIRILRSFQQGNYGQFTQCVNTCRSFGNIAKSKDSYYAFRQYVNTEFWKQDSIEEGFYLYMLYTSCINSLARFGPNGFNNSFGNRESFSKMTEFNFNIIQQKLKLAIIYNLDFFDLIKRINLDNCLLFLDPPYIKSKVGYQNINSTFYEKFVNFIQNSRTSHIIYTDIDHQDVNLSKIILRQDMKNISPNRTNQESNIEVMFYNF